MKKVVTIQSIADEDIGKHLVLLGTAENTKAGAILILKNASVYLEEKTSWPNEKLGKTLLVAGILEKKLYVPKSELKNGIQTQGKDSDSLDFVLTKPSEIDPK